MERKSVIDNFKNEAKIALSNIIDKIDEVGGISIAKVKIYNLQGKIKNYQILIGDIVYQNQDRFSQYPEIVIYLEKIKNLKKEIEIREEEIIKIKKKGKNEEAVSG